MAGVLDAYHTNGISIFSFPFVVRIFVRELLHHELGGGQSRLEL
jgi:hypothetical protein